jgi:exopolyphosphatase / guanosine-5'-triphosphate,3'-diphosphate pyrophosphatase
VTEDKTHTPPTSGATEGEGLPAVIHPRWEWRTFGESFGEAEEAFAALTPTGVQETDELYLLSETRPDINIKVRFNLLDIKKLVEVDENGLEQWRPIVKDEFPLNQEGLADVFGALELSVPPVERETYTLDQFVAELAPIAGLRPVNVHKRRVRYEVGGCTSEVTDLVADGHENRTIAIESEDAAAVVAAVESVGLADYLDTNYGAGLAATLAGAPPRYAVIDVGTNSVKFHIAERKSDGTMTRLIDRAVITRVGEGLDETKRIGPEPMERTAKVIAEMANEAREAGVRALAVVATAAFRIAENRDEARDFVRARAGVTIELLSGEEESRLAYVGALEGVTKGSGTAVVFDTGGGSSQFTFGHGEQIDERFSDNVGAARFTEQFGLDKAVAADVIDQARAAISSELSRLDGRTAPDAVVGMGGAITNMIAVSKAMAKYDPDVIHGSTLDVKEIDRQIGLYSGQSADERRNVVGLQPGRAEVILAGACIVRTILDKLGAQSLTVSDRGLRHGLLIERFGLPPER